MLYTNQFAENLIAYHLKYLSILDWYNAKSLFNFIDIDNDIDLIKIAFLETVEQKNYTIYHDHKFWSVNYIGTHDMEKDIYKLSASLLQKQGFDVIVIPNDSKRPTHWVYYVSLDY